MSNRFVIIAPTFNAEKTARQSLLSLASQTHSNWKLVIIDDMSTDDTARTILQLARSLQISDKIHYIFNTEKKWEVANVLEGLKHCDDDDIIVRLDMDDYLSDNSALEILDLIYRENPEIDVAWTNHRWFEEGTITDFNISRELPQGADPYQYEWVSSHLKTFRKRLLNNVKDENYRGQDGNYFRRIGDQAFMLPALKNARKWAYIPMCMYAYRCSLKEETFQTDDAKFQAAEAEYLRARGYIP